MATPHDITRHHDADPHEDPWVRGRPAPETILVQSHDPGWAACYARLAAAVRRALGPRALAVEHVGSTAVPGLPAKPVIDIDLTVADPADEASYVPALEALDYVLVVREPSWHQHRCLRLQAPRANLHVFGPDCPEVIRHRMFRDWLRTHADERERYAQAKHAAAAATDDMAEYNRHKQDAVRAIYARMFRAAGLLP
ncbi:GrpB family protein [Bordetella parapertussis]|uniref:GrpB family protein n=1 Tax=Bordetella parapertussis (strain Bpp5) TaxID=1208660 RepID=K0MBM6_BORPB|nr:GrpB family protein [Bordetella parapertussis]CCJ48627.1 conserved hypothetical protein [Bordetella parapertussis Bpp5]